MRRILVDYARTRKRGGAEQQVSLDQAAIISKQTGPELLALDEALKSLAELDSRKSRIVELRYFGGLSAKETAEVLQVSPRTVEREWSLARAWLHRELRKGEQDTA
jgi:RNA polymerase sigma factor (TIGR02999 family)